MNASQLCVGQFLTGRARLPAPRQAGFHVCNVGVLVINQFLGQILSRKCLQKELKAIADIDISLGYSGDELKQFLNDERTRMWANAQRDGRPAEYRWRPLFNATKFG